MNDDHRKRGPVRLDRILDGVLEECGLTGRLAEREVLTAWPEIVGREIAAHVRALDLREGVLLLQADHGAWRHEMTLLLPSIRESFARRFGPDTVREIRWARPWTHRRRPDHLD